MAVRHTGPEALASGRAPVSAGHLGAGPGLVDEHQPGRIEFELVLEPGLSALQDVWAILLRGVGCLFLRVIWWRAKNRHRLVWVV